MYIIFFIFISILVFLIYTHQPKYTSSELENFTPNNESVALNTQKLFLKNNDLQYYDNKSKLNLSEESKLNSNQIAPIIDNNVGKNSSPQVSVPDVPKELTNRNPDSSSTYSEYVIPLPNFKQEFPDSRFQRKIKRRKRKIDVEKPIVGLKRKSKILSDDEDKSVITKDIVNIPSDENTNPISSSKCQFISSLDELDPKNPNNSCSTDYPIYTGATFSSLSSSLNCNSNIDIEPAEAIAIIGNGTVTDIKLISKGKNYSQNPEVYVRGDGDGCILKSHITNGQISHIDIVDGGKNYTSTPTVIIDKPDPKINCNLCCKI